MSEMRELGNRRMPKQQKRTNNVYYLKWAPMGLWAHGEMTMMMIIYML